MRVMHRWWVTFACALIGCAQPDPDFACTIDDNCIRDGETGRCEVDGFCTFEDAECAGGRRFTEHSGALSNECLRFTSACRIPAAAELAWELEVETNANYLTQTDVPYTTDLRAQLAAVAFSRVAYCLELDEQVAYAELDDFTGGDVSGTGIPTDSFHDTAVSNLTVRSNVDGVPAVELGNNGRIEMWPDCYGEGPNAVFDFDDDVSDGGADCYGSFQVHAGDVTVFAFNHWTGGGTEIDDLGIGNSPDGNPDWTFAQTAGSYTRRVFQAFIVP